MCPWASRARCSRPLVASRPTPGAHRPIGGDQQRAPGQEEWLSAKASCPSSGVARLPRHTGRSGYGPRQGHLLGGAVHEGVEEEPEGEHGEGHQRRHEPDHLEAEGDAPPLHIRRGRPLGLDLLQQRPQPFLGEKVGQGEPDAGDDEEREEDAEDGEDRTQEPDLIGE